MTNKSTSKGASKSTSKAAAEIEQWLQKRLPADQFTWLSDRLDRLAGGSDRDLYISFGMIPRKLGRDDLALTDEEMRDARNARKDWDPSAWSIDSAARTLVLCKLADLDGAGFSDRFIEFCRSADLSESIALYSSVPLYAQDDALDAQIGEGLRTNIRAVFEAIAHRNPYPREQFDQNRWNHMVLKALFVDSTLAPIQGIDERANAELALILRDYAHERWAAKRPVTVELWRCIGPFAQGDLIEDLNRVVETGTRVERDAALLALSQSSDTQARTIVEHHPDTLASIKAGDLCWENIATGDSQS